MNNLLNLCTSFSILISFAITLISTKYLIPILVKFKYGQSILKIGPSWHLNKQGTPTMGGVTIIISILISSFLFSLFYYFISNLSVNYITETKIIIIKNISGFLMAFLFGMIGFMDDYVKIKNKSNLGITAKQKLILQFLIVSLHLFMIYMSEVIYCGKPNTNIDIPFLGLANFGIFYYIIWALVIVGIVNAVNLTDGVDGLCSSVTFVNSIAFIVIFKFLKIPSYSILSSCLAGSCIGFLVWNFHPAKIFMGDTGSLFLGGLICALGFGSKNIFLLIILSSVYVLEMLSVIIQVMYYKISGGKRIFKMSPIHHHFEMIGYKESKICFLFTIFTFVCAIFAILFLIFFL